MGRCAEAVAVFERALQADPGNKSLKEALDAAHKSHIEDLLQGETPLCFSTCMVYDALLYLKPVMSCCCAEQQ